MRKCILLLSILLIIISCETKQNVPNQKNVEQTILALEHKWLDRWAAGDPLGVAEYCAEDVTYFQDVDAEIRIDGLDEFRNYLTSLVGSYPSHTYEIVDPKVQVYGDIAISTLHYNPTFDGEPGTPWKATDVYRLINGEWRLVHANWTEVKKK